MENFAPYRLKVSIYGLEALHNLSISLKHCIVPDRRGAFTFPWVLCAFGVRNTLFHTIGFHLSVTLLALYIELHPCDYLCYPRSWSLGDGFFKVPCFETIMKFPYEHFLVLMDNSNGGFIETNAVFPR